MSRILVVEDQEMYQKMVGRTLSHHQLDFATDVDSAMQIIRGNTFDLILLDISLPKKSGYTLFTELESENKKIPIMCLTGKLDVTDKVTAFSLGAEDYIVKPFDPIELRARVDARLNRSKQVQTNEELIRSGDLEIDLGRHRVSVFVGGVREEVVVTQTEFKLLVCLARKPDRVYSRDQLLVAAWGEDANVLDRVVDVHLCSLRKKLKSYIACIHSVPGVGYRFAPDNRKSHGKQAA